MFKSRNKSKNPIGFAADTVFDAFLPKKEKSHKKRNAAVVVGIATGATLLAGALSKKQDSPS
jgi:hypothetical protein